ncbi:hypothetical protein [Halomarina oriensis]|uniref:hypothetical protein n=1 Tax=Halomarina oriensis TaxID=671145 RepID=UPI001303C0B5|nr:hypothetical protein [Halomarina oriensis]
MSEQRSETRESAGADSDRENEEEKAVDTSHLDGLADGCGCAEVMDHLSEQREE